MTVRPKAPTQESHTRTGAAVVSLLLLLTGAFWAGRCTGPVHVDVILDLGEVLEVEEVDAPDPHDPDGDGMPGWSL